MSHAPKQPKSRLTCDVLYTTMRDPKNLLIYFECQLHALSGSLYELTSSFSLKCFPRGRCLSSHCCHFVAKRNVSTYPVCQLTPISPTLFLFRHAALQRYSGKIITLHWNAHLIWLDGEVTPMTDGSMFCVSYNFLVFWNPPLELFIIIFTMSQYPGHALLDESFHFEPQVYVSHYHDPRWSSILSFCKTSIALSYIVESWHSH